MAHWLSVGTICRDFGLHVRPMEFCPTAGTRVSSEGLRSDSNPLQVWVGLDWEFHAPHQILDQVAARRHGSVNTTRIYTHSNVQQIREAIERRNRLSTTPVEAVQ